VHHKKALSIGGSCGDRRTSVAAISMLRLGLLLLQFPWLDRAGLEFCLRVGRAAQRVTLPDVKELFRSLQVFQHGAAS